MGVIDIVFMIFGSRCDAWNAYLMQIPPQTGNSAENRMCKPSENCFTRHDGVPCSFQQLSGKVASLVRMVFKNSKDTLINEPATGDPAHTAHTAHTTRDF
ncbi:hypothetical protein [Paraburkholderia pallida]|uniref:Uncharacterized protein n=1 Tax=Paraburkholderia pallida TaxID=2547399 RepID=A0A4P7D0H7_9BURK|nr:hypothetical protein [Paraburkholderia pallida]QBR02136.1 hypothetical protein E1956_34055 [Paraburkholderia pallida]